MTDWPGSARPLWLDVPPDPVFGTYHPPTGEAPSSTAVLICPPWGWDEITSYASRRAWAERLAADGYPTLRVDLPGSGDSGGSPADTDRVGAWSRATAAAAAWLASQPGVQRVAAIGLGLGGLVAADAIAGGAPIDDLVLWAAPARGRAYLREQRAFGAMQSSRFSLSGEPEPSLLPEDWLEVGGFVMSAETISALAVIDMRKMPLGRLQRALLLERDNMGRDVALEAYLGDHGTIVTTGRGNGWKDMVFHPERYAPPLAVFDVVGAWLADAPAPHLTPGAPPPRAVDRLALLHEGSAITETPVRIQESFGSLFGILGQPGGGTRTPVCAVFLNAGAVRRIGPNRMWVEASRRWNARGMPTIRMDLEGIGDAGGDPRRYADVANYYTEAIGDQVTDILDDLQARGFGPHFVLIGLCAGGYWAFNTAASDPRVVEAIILNPRAMVWDRGIMTRREARKVQRLLEPGLWEQVIRGQVRPSRVLQISRAVAARTATRGIRAARHVRGGPPSGGRSDPTTSRLDALRALGTRVVIAFSGDEPVYDELAADGILDRLGVWPNVTLESIPGRDHTVRPIVAQRFVHDLLDRELARALIETTPSTTPGSA